MATNYHEFSVLGTNLLTEIRAAILGSTDWSQPNAAGNPNLLKSTTSRGAQLVVDINDAAPTLNLMTIGVYRTHDGTTAGSKVQRFLRYKRLGTGTLATTTYHVTVSAGKEHLFLTIEGPRAGEANLDAAGYGSLKNYFFVCDLVPYFDTLTDLAPAVVVGGRMSNSGASASGGSHLVQVSRDRSDTQSWVPARLQTLTQPNMGNSIPDAISVQKYAEDGNLYLSPYVVFEDSDGIRGRLSSIFFAGFNFSDTLENAPAPVATEVTYNAQQYRLLAPNKTDATELCYDQLGSMYNANTGTFMRSPVIAVPSD